MNDDVFEWTTLPDSVAVFGTGAIGLELGQALCRLGVRVRIFGRGGAVGQLTDPAVRAVALGALRTEMPVDPAATVRAVRRSGDGVEVHFEDEAGEAHVEHFAFCLAATGRRPNLARLALENSGLALDAKGVPVFDRATMQCGSAPIFLAGDALTRRACPFTRYVDEGQGSLARTRLASQDVKLRAAFRRCR